MELETRGLAVRAALAGAGALVVDASLISPDLEAGRLALLMNGHILQKALAQRRLKTQVRTPVGAVIKNRRGQHQSMLLDPVR